MQLANRLTDQSKLFPVIVLLQYARLSYPSQCAILGCFVQIRTASVMQADGNVLRKFRIREERVFRSSVASRAPAVNRSGPRLLSCALGCLSAMSPRRGNHRGRLPRAGVRRSSIFASASSVGCRPEFLSGNASLACWHTDRGQNRQRIRRPSESRFTKLRDRLGALLGAIQII
jgi:hypothetical protein